jgi:DNA polymerase-4
MSRVILHADMDAFYAAIEQRDRPELRGKPVIVGGLGPRGVVSTASYEARVFGVHSALPGAQARRLCPDGIFVPGRMARYVEVSREIQGIFRGFTDLVEPLSLDEAFLDVTGSVRLFGDGEAMAQALRAQVFEATHLAVSVGVASNKFVAKVASDQDKPDGLTLVQPGQEAAFLAPLPVSRLWGAGRVTQKRLTDLGLHTLGDLQQLSQQTLEGHLGATSGAHFHALCRGQDTRPVVTGGAPKSISRETTFGEDVSADESLRSTLLALCEDVGRRLRRQNLRGGTLRLKLRYPPFQTLTRQNKLEPPCDDDLGLYHAALALFEAARPSGKPVRLIGVGAADLQSGAASHQGQLFSDDAPGRRAGEQMNATLDAIRERFGPGAVRRAGSAENEPRPFG